MHRYRGIESTLIVVLAVLIALAPGTPAHAGIDEWTSNGPFGGNISELAIDPQNSDNLYAGTNGFGVFRSADGGRSWESVSQGRLAVTSVTALAVDSQNPSTLFAGFGGAVYRSRNRGELWTQVTQGLPGLVDCQALAVHPRDSQVIFAATRPDGLAGGGGIYRSLDGGDTWSLAGLEGANVQSVTIDPQRPTTIYLGTTFFPYKSTDGGETWTRMPDGLDRSSVLDVVIDPADSDTLYAATTGGVFLSTDGGENWTARNQGLPAGTVGTALVVHPRDPNVLLLGTNQDGAFLTTDRGAEWTPFVEGFIRDNINALAVVDGEQPIFYAGTFVGGVFQRTLADDAWSAFAQGMHNTFVRDLEIDPDNPSTLYTATSTGAFKSTDYGASWSSINTGLAEPLPGIQSLAIAPSSPETLYAATLDGIYQTTDGGSQWNPAGDALAEAGVRVVVVDPVEASTLYASTETGLFKSNDRAASWMPLDSGIEGLEVHGVTIDPTDPATVYLLTSDGYFKSTDGGLSWTSITEGLGPGPLGSLTIDPQNPSTLYVGSSIGGVFRSTDAGDHWDLFSRLPTVQFVSSFVVDPRSSSTLYAGTADGVFRSTDGGEEWRPVADGPLHKRVSALVIDPQQPTTLYAGTSGGGVFDIQLIGGTTTLELLGGRFLVEVDWRDFVNLMDRGTVAIADADTGSDVALLSRDSTVVSFFEPDNWEMLAKVLDGREINGHFWVFLAAATDVELTTTVTDTSCGNVVTYQSALGTPSRAVTDIEAFPECAEPQPASCEATDTTICLGDGRFQLDFAWRDFAGATGEGSQVLLPRSGLAQSDDSGLFEFFDQGNWEMLVKVLDGCSINGHFWVFAAAATNVEYTLRVIDTETGAVQGYFNPLGQAAPALTDTNAFACP
ncbi:MAG: hypothetical protein AAF560_31740 [Acidobacteriota bacterium]